jgi:hypothetical protein
MAGPSGTGKTTLCEYISKEYNIPFVTTSTKPLWDKYGITSHEQLINKTLNDKLWGLNFQYEVLNYRVRLLKGLDQFVTDRSPIDNLVYFLLQNSHLLNESQTKEYINLCAESMMMFNSLITVPYLDNTLLEDDGKRVNNKYYQMSVNSIFPLASFLIEESGKANLEDFNIISMSKWDMEWRKNKIAEFIIPITLK